MAGTPMTAEDVAAALTGLTINVVDALMNPRHQTNEEILQVIANALDDLAEKTPASPASETWRIVAAMLMQSEV